METRQKKYNKRLYSKIYSVCCEVFKVDQIDKHKNLSDIAISDRKISQLINRLNNDLEISLDQYDLSKKITLIELVFLVEEKILEQEIFSKNKKTDNKIPKASQRKYFPLSRAQERLWVLYKLEPRSSFYNMSFVREIKGNLDLKSFKKSLNSIVQRHEPLRTNFKEIKGSPKQFVKDFREINLIYKDISNLNKNNKKQKKENFLKTQTGKPFKLEKDLLMRPALIKLTQGKYIFILNFHHIILDDWSARIIFKELAKYYSSYLKKEEIQLPGIGRQFRDYVAWEKNQEKTKELKKSEKYWLNKFKTRPPVLNLPIDNPRPPIQTFNGDFINFELGANTSKKLIDICKDNNISLYVLIFSLVNIFLYKITGQKDLVVGINTTHRDKVYIEDAVGFFINILAIRSSIKDDLSFIQTASGIYNSLLKDIAHKDFYFDLLIEKLEPERDMSRPPFIDVFFQFAKEDRDQINKIGNLKIKKYPYKLTTSQFDLKFFTSEINGKIRIGINYNTDLFDKDTANSILNAFRVLIKETSKNSRLKISDIELADKDSKNKLINSFNKTKSSYPKDKTIHQIFEKQAKLTPHKKAIRLNSQSITYQELNRRANQLARYLGSQGLERESVVALIMERSFERFISILAILKAGGAYLPIDPSHPQQRVNYMIENGDVDMILSNINDLNNFSVVDLKKDKAKAGEIYLTKPNKRIEDFNILPEPDRSAIEHSKYNKYIGHGGVKNFISIQATRGCPFNCLYCHKIWPKEHIYRSAENIINEIKTYYQMGVKRFQFIDDVFNLNIKNSRRFFQLIIKEKLKIQLFFPNGLRGDILTKDYIDLMIEAGTVNLALALETASDRLQKLIKKNLDVGKIKENSEYIVKKYPEVILDLFTMHGFPTETEEEAMKTLNFIKQIKWLHFPLIQILKIFPGTDMEQFAISHGISKKDILRSEKLAYTRAPETLPFSKEFTIKYQNEFINNYFLDKNRLLKVLPYQMKVFTEDELVARYNNYLPINANNFSELLKQLQITKNELPFIDFVSENEVSASNLDGKIKKHFYFKTPQKNALRVLLLDLSQLFSENQKEYYDPVEQPLGLMYLGSYLNYKFEDRANYKILKSRIDFDNYNQLIEEINKFQPDVIGIRSLSLYKDFLHQAISVIKQTEPEVPVIVGGPYSTSSYETLLEDSNIDLAVIGEGEITFSEIIKQIIENNKKLPSQAILKNINGIAFRKKQKERKIILYDALSNILSKTSTTNLKKVAQPNNLAYVIYTSGSTGRPKGVMIEHRSLVNRINWMQKTYPLNERDVILHKTPYTFDVSVWELFWSSFNGSSLALLPPKEEKSPQSIVESISRYKVTTIHFVPSMFSAFLDYVEKNNQIKQIQSLKRVFTSGESLTVKQAEKFNRLLGKKNKTKLINLYGPTEATIDVSCYNCPTNEKIDKVPIGKPISNIQLYVLDKKEKPVPFKIPGELYISGDGLARGYINDPKKTKEVFLPHPFIKGKTIYKTGDLAKMRPDGNIEILGRVDHQVKIRGNRVETEEIKNQLIKYKEIQAVAFKVKKDEDKNSNYLVAYYTTNSKKSIDSNKLRGFLKDNLPEFMIPSLFLYLDEMPLKSNGKIDYQALPEGINFSSSSNNKDLPKTKIEKMLAGIWQEVLGIKTVTLEDNFLNLGGHSLKAIQVSAKLKEKNIDLPIKEIYINSNFKDLVFAIEKFLMEKLKPRKL